MGPDEKAIYLSLAMGLIELVKADEEDTKPKGARAVALKNLYSNCDKIIDFYKIVDWELSKQQQASRTLEAIELLVSRRWSPKLVDRDAKGRFSRREVT
jgi:hypothetical protein